jgi:hypothetical protein
LNEISQMSNPLELAMSDVPELLDRKQTLLDQAQKQPGLEEDTEFQRELREIDRALDRMEHGLVQKSRTGDEEDF